VAETKKRGRRENLKSTKDMTEEERKEFHSKGGKASTDKRRRNKTFKEAMNWILEQQIIPETDDDRRLLEQFPDLTYLDAIAINMAMRSKSKTAKDAVKAAQFSRDTTGELPAQTVNVQQEKAFEITIKTLD